MSANDWVYITRAYGRPAVYGRDHAGYDSMFLIWATVRECCADDKYFVRPLWNTEPRHDIQRRAGQMSRVSRADFEGLQAMAVAEWAMDAP